MNRFLIGFVAGALCFGGYVYAKDVISSFDDRNISVLNSEFTNIDRQLRQLGRGTTDEDITYIKLYNANGTACYVYPDALGTGITVTTTEP